jgi:dTDP-4-dehydrorhamnose 3,5-epimerase
LGTRNITEGIKYQTPEVYTDFRGASELDLSYNHDKVSTSRKNVLRGIHGDFKSYKLITCLYGEIYFVTVDNRKESPTYKKWDWEILNDRSRKQVLLSPGIGNGFLVLSEDSVFHYKWFYEGEYPDVKDQFTLKWNDPNLNIHWPVKEPILQLRDK